MDNKRPRKLASKLLNGVACLLIGLTPEYAFAVDAPASGSPPPASTQPAAEAPPPPAAPADATAPAPTPAPKFTQEQLEQMLAPIALYPDALLAQILPAAAYPLQIVEAVRWMDANGAAVAKQDFSGADAQNWDASVKALVRFPEVIKKLNGDLNWTISLGDATVNQPQDVANAIQTLRAKAMAAGALATTKQQTVTRQSQGGRDVVVIQSTDPNVIYAPSYNPYAIYGWPGYNPALAVATGLLVFGAGVAIGSLWVGNYWNWGTGAFYRPVWPGYPAWRPPYGGWRPGMAVPPGFAGNGIANLSMGARPRLSSWRSPARNSAASAASGVPAGSAESAESVGSAASVVPAALAVPGELAAPAALAAPVGLAAKDPEGPAARASANRAAPRAPPLGPRRELRAAKA